MIVNLEIKFVDNPKENVYTFKKGGEHHGNTAC